MVEVNEPQWEVNVMEVDPDNDTFVSHLCIDNVMPSDTGRYICNVYNGNPDYSLRVGADVNVLELGE